MSSPHQDSLLPRFAQGEEGHETTTKFPCLVCVDRALLQIVGGDKLIIPFC